MVELAGPGELHEHTGRRGRRTAQLMTIRSLRPSRRITHQLQSSPQARILHERQLRPDAERLPSQFTIDDADVNDTGNFDTPPREPYVAGVAAWIDQLQLDYTAFFAFQSIGGIVQVHAGRRLTIDGKVVPQKLEDGTMFIKVKWITVDVEVHLPRWTDYNNACPAARKEWDRFMGQTRLHEQQAHVDKANDFVENLGEEDTLIEGKSPEELKAKLENKAKELQKRLQKIHDACDHGASVDALLHPEKGVCE